MSIYTGTNNQYCDKDGIYVFFFFIKAYFLRMDICKPSTQDVHADVVHLAVLLLCLNNRAAWNWKAVAM